MAYWSREFRLMGAVLTAGAATLWAAVLFCIVTGGWTVELLMFGPWTLSRSVGS